MVEEKLCEHYYKMENLSLPPDKRCKENVGGVNINEASLDKAVNEDTRSKGQILNTYNVKPLLKKKIKRYMIG